MNDWQSWAAAGIVLLTLAAFIFRAIKGKTSKGHCDDCSCGK